MQTVITHPDGVEAGADSQSAKQALSGVEEQTCIDALIAPSRNLSSQQRIEIYANAYYARLLECLRDEFPAMVALLGEDTFHAFAFDYLQSNPSSSYTLADLGRNFHRFLIDSRVREAGDETAVESGQSYFDLMIDLALLERTYSEIFTGPGIEDVESLSAEALSRVPQDSVGALRLKPAPCVRLLRLSTAAHEYAIAVRKSPTIAPQLPEFIETFLVVTRIDYVVRTVPAEPEEYLLLQALVENASLEQAIAKVAEQGSMDEEQMARKFAVWFQKWASDHLFMDFHISDL
ncbi:HvfC/BufC N-terminal domain-containing protein [Aureliella helgolandensis]|nr:DNA-binding domain-containing protein [Aureliella helgolandensis]